MSTPLMVSTGTTLIMAAKERQSDQSVREHGRQPVLGKLGPACTVAPGFAPPLAPPPPPPAACAVVAAATGSFFLPSC